MRVSRFVGRKLIVDYSLLKGFSVDVVKSEERVLLSAQGSIMESAKVFDSMDVKTSDNAIFVSVYASLVFWNRGGCPDFEASQTLQLAPGIYDIRYDGLKGETTFLRTVTV